jgi:sec-independent protein translocase protein TatC
MKATKSKPTKSHGKNLTPSSSAAQQKLPFIAHIAELRKRLFYIAIAIGIGAGAAYSIQIHITEALLRPAGKQEFIYTSPGGGFDFLFKLCLYTGILFAIPVIIYQLLRYLQPLIKQDAARTIMWGSIASGFLATLGILFGYFVGLPAAMHFLLHQFSATTQIQALLTIQAYSSFVMMYLLGSALLFQVPLIMLLINKAKPLKPRKLMSFQRWFIVFAFIVGAIINPSPNIQDQLMLSVPMILMYQLGIVLVWLINRKNSKPKKVVELIRKDEEVRASRLNSFQQAQETWLQTVQTTIKPDAPASPLRATVSAQRPAITVPTRTKPPLASVKQVAPGAAHALPLPSTIIRPTRPVVADVSPNPASAYRPIAVSVQE